MATQSLFVWAASLMFPMASEREQEELVVVSSLPVATVKEAACALPAERKTKERRNKASVTTW